MELSARLSVALAVLLAGCAGAPAPESTSPGLVVDTLASPADLPARGLAGGAVLPDGRLALADFVGGTVWLLDSLREAPAQMGVPGTEPGQLAQPLGIALWGDTIAVVSAGTARVELFAPSGAPAGSIPIAPALLGGPFELLASGNTMAATFGEDSALAIVRNLEGERLHRYGSPLAEAAGPLDPAALKATIRGGDIPAPFRNIALPVSGANGEIWLVLHTEGVIERLSREGEVLARFTLPAEELEPLRAEFFRANTDPSTPGAIVAFLVAAAGVADSTGAWFLLAEPPQRSAVLLRISNQGQLIERLVVGESRGARLLLHDPARDVLYLVNQGDGVVVRVRRAGGA